jgi:hypothetical protein
MENTAGFGRLIGWISIVAGGAALFIGLLISSPEGAMAEFERCLSQQRLGLRHAPCPPPPASGDKVLLIAAGMGSIASGVFFLLLSGILTTLVAIQADQREARRVQERAGEAAAFDQRRAAQGGTAPPAGPAPARYVHPPAPAKRPNIPTRFEMQQRYGEALGNRAWAMLDKYTREGEPLTEQDAVEAARAEIRARQG